MNILNFFFHKHQKSMLHKYYTFSPRLYPVPNIKLDMHWLLMNICNVKYDLEKSILWLVFCINQANKKYGHSAASLWNKYRLRMLRYNFSRKYSLVAITRTGYYNFEINMSICFQSLNGFSSKKWKSSNYLTFSIHGIEKVLITW